MLISLLSWWYGKGLAWKSGEILDSLEKSINTFSLGLLIRTWFAPFRQIDAGGAVNGVESRLRRALDKLISRFIGALLRTAVMFAGVIFISIKAIFGFAVILFWILAPILPIVFLVFFTTDWTPKIITHIRENILDNSNSVQKTQSDSQSDSRSLFKFGGF